MLTLFEADGTTPASSESISLNTLQPDNTKTLLLKNTSQQAITGLLAALIMPAESATLATMTLSLNNRPVPVGATEAEVVLAQVLEAPLLPGDTIPVHQYWKAVSTAAQGLAQARLLLDVVS